MTITVTMDWLVYAYMLLENLFFMYAEELRVRNWRAYYDRLSDLDIDCSQLPTLVENNPVSFVPEISDNPVTAKAELSELDESTQKLWNELQNELGIFDEVMLAPDPNEITYFDDDYYQDNLEDCISIDDLEEEPSMEPTGYEQFSSAKIAEEINGPQQWIVSVIGMEDEYIHVSDGKRIWINVGQQALKIRNHDVLALDVYRSGKQVEVKRLFRLEAGIDLDYSIPDESYHSIEDEKMII